MLPSNHLGFQATSLHVTNGNLRPTEGKVQTQNTGLLSSSPGCQEGQQDMQNSPAQCSTGRPLLATLVTAPTSQKTRQSWRRRSREGHVDEDSNAKTESGSERQRADRNQPEAVGAGVSRSLCGWRVEAWGAGAGVTPGSLKGLETQRRKEFYTAGSKLSRLISLKI